SLATLACQSVPTRRSSDLVLREIFGQAKRELVIIDPWVGEGLFDLLEPFVSKLTSLQILTATNAPKTALLSYKAFHTQYPRCEIDRKSTRLNSSHQIISYA